MLSILTYSVCSFASGLSTSVVMLAAFRFVLGLGMGGEWNTGATLVAETWPSELRAKAFAVVQSSWAIGYALAALVAGMVLRYGNWRMVFFVGILPALVTLWIRRGVPESEMWNAHRRAGKKVKGLKHRGHGGFHGGHEGTLGSDLFLAIFRLPYLQEHGRSSIAQFFRVVCMVGTVYLDSALSFASRRARRPGLWHYGDGDTADRAESDRHVSRISSASDGLPIPGRRKSFMLYLFMAAFWCLFMPWPVRRRCC